MKVAIVFMAIALFSCISSEEIPRCSCEAMTTPVCGTDNRTYGHHCFLRCEQRMNQPDLKVLHKGECKNSEQDFCECDTIPNDAVCGINRTTYSSYCELECKRHNNKINWPYLAYSGQCVPPY